MPCLVRLRLVYHAAVRLFMLRLDELRFTVLGSFCHDALYKVMANLLLSSHHEAPCRVVDNVRYIFSGCG